MKTIDCRNMACPAPVITVKKALEEEGELLVLLDGGAPRENVGRFARTRGCQVSEHQDGNGGWMLTIKAGDSTAIASASGTANNGQTLLVTSSRLGDGPEELGTLLMKNFIHTLLETAELPSRMLFLNTGVFLTTEGSDVLEALDKLTGMGVEILSCGLCLDYFGRKDKLRAGGTTNMLTTVESLLGATKVIRL
jgi:selenium metabolism protein YedF